MSLHEIGKLNPNAFDMETVLTRAVQRVLSNNLLDFTSNSVEKPKVHFQQATNHAQVRLVAEQLCRRIERRYERKLVDELEKERGKMERKLGQIREEYRDELEQKKKDLLHERTLMEERQRERERTLQHMMDIRALDKEGSIDVQRKILENRQTELKIAAERLEKANEEFKRRMKEELETLRLEWEKLAIKETEMNAAHVDLSQARIVQEMRNKFDSILKENDDLRKSLIRIEKEKLDLETRNTKTEEELRLTLFRMRDRENTGESTLVKELLDQNQRLKEDILKNEIRSRGDSSSEMGRLRAEYSNREEAHLLKMKEQQQIIELMNTRIRHLTSERNYLKKEIKEVREESYYRGTRKGKREKKKKVSSSSESLSSSESSSSLSAGSVEIANFKKRMGNLDQMAKQLDASVELLTMTASRRRDTTLEEDTHHGYDDFCRGILHNGTKQSSPVKAVERRGSVPRQPVAEDIVVRPKAAQEPSRREPESAPKEEPPPKETEFERRLRERNEQQASRRIVTLASEEPLREETKSQENPLFQPTPSSAMADYMSMFMQPPKTSAASAEVTLPEEVQFDPISKSDDEIDW